MPARGPSVARLQGVAAVILIGIDPGVNTGFAVWCATERRLMSVDSMTIDSAMDEVRRIHREGNLHSVTFEDARLRTWYGSKGKEALQGAGSIKRDCGIWSDFLGRLGVAYRSVKPAAGATKWTAERFASVTGWVGRTNEHGRDAALLVYGARAA